MPILVFRWDDVEGLWHKLSPENSSPLVMQACNG